MNRYISMIAAGAVLAAGAVSAQAGSRLGTSALRGLFPGKFHAVYDGKKLRLTAKSNGALIGRYQNKVDTGRWSVRSGKLCISFKVWLEGKTSCASVYRKGRWLKADRVTFRRM